MKVTVCQLHEPPDHLEVEWRRLAEHVDRNDSDLVLLPEMPFHPWLARDREVDTGAWEAAVEAHDRWIIEPEEGEVLGVTTVEQPFLTCEIDLARAEAAKSSYPRYVKE